MSNNLRINGNGHTIDALNQSRIFQVSPNGHVTFENITFVNGHVEALMGAYGGAIYGDFDAGNCIFINNSAHYGGALCVPDGKNSTILDCIFANNYASNGGGAIYVLNANLVEVTVSTFENNNATDGGAVYTSGGKSDFYRCTFKNNTDFEIYNCGNLTLNKNGLCRNPI